MGTIRKGALGGFSGKAGSIIGSSWRDNKWLYINGETGPGERTNNIYSIFLV